MQNRPRPCELCSQSQIVPKTTTQLRAAHEHGVQGIDRVDLSHAWTAIFWWNSVYQLTSSNRYMLEI